MDRSHRFPARCLVRWRKPQRGETRVRDRGEFRFNEAPPLVFAVFRLRTIPIKRLQHHTHNSPSFCPNENIAALHPEPELTKAISYVNVTNCCADLCYRALLDDCPSRLRKEQRRNSRSTKSRGRVDRVLVAHYLMII